MDELMKAFARLHSTEPKVPWMRFMLMARESGWTASLDGMNKKQACRELILYLEQDLEGA